MALLKGVFAMSFIRITSAVLATTISAMSAHAETCMERFVKAATEGNGDGEYRQIVTQKIEGSPAATVNEFIMNSHRHWVSKSITPKAGGWTLLHGGVMYSSTDQGTSWNEITKFDEQAAEVARAQQKSDVEGAAQVECGTETVDGKVLDRVHGQYEVTVGFKTTQVHTYWIEPESGLIVRSEYDTISPAFKSKVSQKMIPFADAVVPLPE